MIIYSLLIALLALPLTHAGVIDPAPEKTSVHAEKFYPIKGLELILNPMDFVTDSSDFDDLLIPKGESIRKLSTLKLKTLGLEPGATLQTVDFTSGAVSKFTLPPEVYVRMIPNSLFSEGGGPKRYYRSFRVLLTTDLKEIKKIEASQPSETGDEVGGVAYIGKEVKLKSGKATEVLKPLPLADPDVLALVSEYKKSHPKFTLENAARGSVGSRTYLQISGKFAVAPEAYPETGSNLLIKKNETGFLSLTPELRTPDYAISGNKLMSADIIEGAEGVLIRPGEVMHDCDKLLILYKDRMEEVKLKCDSGGC